MDKLDLVLDIIGHPEKYSSKELERLLADHETKALYDEMCLLSASSFSTDIPDDEDVTREWQRFERMHMRRPLLVRLIGNRAAAVAAVVVTAAVAVAVGVGISFSIPDGAGADEDSAREAEAVESIGRQATAGAATGVTDSIADISEPVVFEDETLSAILTRIGRAYGVTVRFTRPDVRDLRLYFSWTPSTPLAEVVNDLNNFDRIDIVLKDDTMIVK